jgi:hypothetical protein
MDSNRISDARQTFPISPEGVLAFGVDPWLKSYSSPVTSREFQSAYDRILSETIRLLSPIEGSPTYWTTLCNYKLLLHLTHTCFFKLRLDRLAEQGFQSLRTDREIPLEQANSKLARELLTSESENHFGLGWTEYARCLWRILRINHGYASPLPAFFPPRRSDGLFYVLGSSEVKELKSYAKSLRGPSAVLQPRLFFPSNRLQVPASERNDTKNFVDALFQFLKREFPHVSGFDEQTADVLNTWFLGTLNAILQSRNHLRNWPACRLLATGIGNIHHRILAVAWRQHGGRVVNFTHGNSYCLAYKPGSITTGSHAVVDEYVASSKGEAELLNDAVRDFGNGLPTFRSVRVGPVNVYRPIRESFHNMKIPSTVRRVMLVGYPMSYHYHLYHPEQNALPHLHLELRLVAALKKHGFEVVYKAHPDTYREVRGLFEGRVDAIIPEPFEKVCRDGLADCALFGTPSTTTFGYVLLSNMPVTVLDIDGTIWHPNVKPMARRRCSFVAAKADEQGRIEFHEEELIDAVRRSPCHLDMEIVERYALE